MTNTTLNNTQSVKIHNLIAKKIKAHSGKLIYISSKDERNSYDGKASALLFNTTNLTEAPNDFKDIFICFDTTETKNNNNLEKFIARHLNEKDVLIVINDASYLYIDYQFLFEKTTKVDKVIVFQSLTSLKNMASL